MAAAVGASAWVVERAPELIRIVALVGIVFGVSAWLGAAKLYKSLAQELIVFAALPLAAAWAETATRGYMVRETVGMWIVLVVAFWGAVFAVRVRSRGPGERRAALAFALVAAVGGALIAADVIGLSPSHAWLLVPTLIRLAAALVFGEWWMGLSIKAVGLIETAVALAMVATAALAG